MATTQRVRSDSGPEPLTEEEIVERLNTPRDQWVRTPNTMRLEDNPNRFSTRSQSTPV
jgi:hypothetical protein